MKIQDVMRASSVKRWHIVETARPQSLAEHQWSVAMLTDEICKRLGYPAENRKQLVYAAMVHDNDEVISGDAPSPTKGAPKAYPPEKGGAIVKAADLLEALWFIAQHGVGRHGKAVEKDCADRLMLFLRTCQSPHLGPIVSSILTDLTSGEYTI